MIHNVRNVHRRVKQAFYYSMLPRVVDFLTVLSTFRAPQALKKAAAKRILVDNTVLYHAVTHETAWVDTGRATAGNMEIDTGYMARIPVHRDDDESDAARSVRYLPGIARLARRGHIKLAVSDELRDEQWTQPAGRFRGYGYFDHSLFSGLDLERLRDPEYTVVIGPTALGYRTMEEQREYRLAAKSDPLFRNLTEVLGPRNSQDAWHITTAERHDCYCFLTMDFSLIRNVSAQSGNKALKALRTRVMTPEDFGRKFLIDPIPPRLFSYHCASFPVNHKENWPDSKRHKPRRR